MAKRPSAILIALITAGAALTAALPAHAAISCDTDTTGGSTFYDGPSASKKYDARFSNSASIPNLSTQTPQGAGTWYNWDGSGKNLLLVASYREGADSQIYGIDPSTEYNGTAYLVYESGSYLYASDPATLNVIPRLHKATISSLTSLVP